MITTTIILLIVIALAALVIWCGAGTYFLDKLMLLPGAPLPDPVRDNRDPSDILTLNPHENKDPILVGLTKIHTSIKDNSGICRMLLDAMDIEEYVAWRARDWLREQFAVWPQFSGSPLFPVPAPNDYLPGRDVSIKCLPDFAYCDLPKWEGEYGASRRALLAFLIQRRREQVARGTGK